jgi:outer membrane protein OmpA-like peptidoglycan-associated protein|tara:strand:- start:14826 stop:16859 length:2034 start_codon:yes stop_codon:yes gene_type:complete
MFYKTVFTFISLLLILTVYGQDEGCFEDVSEKAIKLYQKGSDKKINKLKRLKYLDEAIEAEEDFGPAHFRLAIEKIKTARYNGTSFKASEDHLLNAERNCPEFHSDIYYYLAEIYLGRKEYEKAVYYQKIFLNFKSDDESKYSRDIAKKTEQVTSDLKHASFYANAFANPVPFNPTRVDEASTEADEYLPLLTPDNKQLFFTRKSAIESKVNDNPWASENQNFLEQFTVAHREESIFTEGIPMLPPFNKRKSDYYGGTTISIDNKHLIITVCRPSGSGFNNCDLYSSDYVYDLNGETGLTEWHWTELVNLGPNVNTERGWESQPSLSGDGQSLFFASFRENSLQIDIYKSARDANGNWGPAERLPEPINSEYHDKAPYIHSDSKTLYFASDRPMGFGGFDVFFTKYYGKNGWMKPKNIGFPINTEEDEHGFVVSTGGKKVFFASDKLGDKFNGLDIYTFDLYKEARPSKVAFVGGEVHDDHGNPVKRGKIEVKNMKTKEVQEVKVDSIDGRYAAIVSLEESDQFVINLKGENVAFESKLITFKDTTEEADYVEVIMEQEELKVGESYQLEDIQYETNSADIKLVSTLMLGEFADYLINHPNIKVAIYGHTDDVGNQQTNLVLSTDRAYSVTAYLQDNGVGKNRLSYKGFGETKPLVSNQTEEGKRKNRRTEFVILEK